MFKLEVKGGIPLEGDVCISGSKNAALPVLAATILAEGVFEINNVPKLQDISTMLELLSFLDISCEPLRDDGYRITNAGGVRFESSYELVKRMRASILVLGPLLAKRGRARVSLPGGCAIGERPVDMHIHALEKMGAKILVTHGYIEADASELRGTQIDFRTTTVTGTENIMMAAVLAKGTTVLNNAASEPEVVDLAVFLRSMGANIEGDGTSVIIIEGVSSLKPSTFSIMPDRIEAGTFICAAAGVAGDIKIHSIPLKFMEAVIERVKAAGVKVYSDGETTLRVVSNGRLSAQDIITKPYPGFPTDMQAQFMAVMTTAKGISYIDETIFENRFMHIAELKRMGADITLKDGRAVVCGVNRLSGAPVMASDLRASAGLVIAALMANNTSIIDRIYHLDRGYQEFDKKLRQLGAKVVRINE
jgi:UDP-N-acetylglucosamine 1-carboxyvinyltransferase